MSKRFSLIISIMAVTVATSSIAVNTPAANNTLPDIGTAAGATLSIPEESQLGDFYLRQLRAHAPLIYDPLLTRYLNQLGQRLLAHANTSQPTFRFSLIQNGELNAFALFGGNVILHTGLFKYADTEGQLASVMAHEISHVTQRHLARAMEAQKQNLQLTWLGALSSALLTMVNPQASMAALAGTLAGSQQSVLSFTQANEQEADQLGLQLLQRAGFDPRAMADFLQKLADISRYASKPPEMLLTHPLPNSRLADARNRTKWSGAAAGTSSQDFYLAKARALAMYPTDAHRLNDDLFTRWQQGNADEQLAARYAASIQLLREKRFASAQALLLPLLKQHPANLWLLDVLTDIDIGLNQSQQAVARLRSASDQQNPVIQINLANALIEAKLATEAIAVLHRYTWENPDDPNGWDLLANVCAKQGLLDAALSARAEQLALTGEFQQAITLLSSASKHVPVGSTDQARYDARIDQLNRLQQQFARFQKSER